MNYDSKPIRNIILTVKSNKYITATTVLWPFVRDCLGEPVPEETLTHPPSWLSSNPYQLLPSTTIHGILPVQITCLTIFLCTISLHVLFGLPLDLKLCTSYSVYFFIQSMSSFRKTCPYHLNLFCYSISGTEPFRSRANLLPGANWPIGLWPIRSLANSLPGTFVPWPFRSLELSLRGPFAPDGQNHYLLWKKFIQRNQSNLKHAVERAT